MSNQNSRKGKVDNCFTLFATRRDRKVRLSSFCFCSLCQVWLCENTSSLHGLLSCYKDMQSTHTYSYVLYLGEKVSERSSCLLSLPTGTVSPILTKKRQNRALALSKRHLQCTSEPLTERRSTSSNNITKYPHDSRWLLAKYQADSEWKFGQKKMINLVASNIQSRNSSGEIKVYQYIFGLERVSNRLSCTLTASISIWRLLAHPCNKDAAEDFAKGHILDKEWQHTSYILCQGSWSCISLGIHHQFPESMSVSVFFCCLGRNRTQLAWHRGIYASKILPTHSSHQIPSKSAWSQNLFLHLSSASPGGHKKTLENLKNSDLGRLQLCSIKTVQVLQNLSYIWKPLM